MKLLNLTMKMNKIIVFGGNGFVGKNLKKYSSKNIVFPTSSNVNLLNLPHVLDYLSNEKPDLVINLAGKVGGILENTNNQLNFLISNSLINLNLISSSIKAGVPNFLNISSSCIYPPNLNVPIDEEDLLSSGIEKTNEGYALAKIIALKACQFQNTGLYKTLIPCNLFGPHDNFDLKSGHMIPSVIHKIHKSKLNDEKVTIWGDGSAKREFMFVEDLIDFIFYSINNFEKIPNIINVGTGVDYSILEYYQMISEVIGFSGDFEFDLSKPTGMKRKLMSIEKIKSLGWQPRHDIKTSINKTYQYFLENYEI